MMDVPSLLAARKRQREDDDAKQLLEKQGLPPQATKVLSLLRDWEPDQPDLDAVLKALHELAPDGEGLTKWAHAELKRAAGDTSSDVARLHSYRPGLGLAMPYWATLGECWNALRRLCEALTLEAVHRLKENERRRRAMTPADERLLDLLTQAHQQLNIVRGSLEAFSRTLGNENMHVPSQRVGAAFTAFARCAARISTCLPAGRVPES